MSDFQKDNVALMCDIGELVGLPAEAIHPGGVGLGLNVFVVGTTTRKEEGCDEYGYEEFVHTRSVE